MYNVLMLYSYMLMCLEYYKYAVYSMHTHN